MRKNTSILLVAMAFLINSCKFEDNSLGFEKTYFGKNQGNEYNIRFKKSKDTIFLFYTFYFDEGKYINAPNDSNDYAGYFLISSIKNGQVIVKVKNYRIYWENNMDKYDLQLKVADSTLTWIIDSSQGIFDYFPNRLVLTGSSN